MRQHLKEYGKYIEITGYGNVDFSLAETFLKSNRKENKNVEIQFFDANVIATQEHVLFAALSALQAFRNRTNISKSLAVEAILYASAQRQIQKAIQRCGIKPETKNVAVMLLAEEQKNLDTMSNSISFCFNLEPDERVLELSEAKETRIKQLFGISGEELAAIAGCDDIKKAIVNLVIERIALLSTQL